MGNELSYSTSSLVSCHNLPRLLSECRKNSAVYVADTRGGTVGSESGWCVQRVGRAPPGELPVGDALRKI